MRHHAKPLGLLCSIVLALAVFAAPVQAHASWWVANNAGWWLQDDASSYPAKQWRNVNGNWYWFDGNGYMAIGWR